MHLEFALRWTRSHVRRAMTRQMTAKKAMCGIHSHLAFLKRMNRKRQEIATTPSTTKYP